MKHISSRSRASRRQRGGSIAEFGPVLFVFFAVLFFPLIGFVSYMDGVVTVTFAANAAARAAGSAATRTQAIENMKATRDQIVNGPLGSFARITPVGEGMQLAVLVFPNSGGTTEKERKVGTAAVSTVNPDNSVDTTDHFYQYQVNATYNIAPLFFPIPPSPMNFSSTTMVEHPEGVNS